MPWRIRVGDYRVIYEIHDGRLVVTVITIGHRRETSMSKGSTMKKHSG
ncbi:type II toxin-antitoxin system RelE/ParE family toxin [Flavitalea sp. BT771]|nr:type II toxin-antitoxin system RelE/ParE family toxin [Flavitalea sp. BT771]MDO6433255.1 type II toxin-antitoxin system RelE/ParE family toxin [Flavitalea sp. BT771]